VSAADDTTPGFPSPSREVGRTKRQLSSMALAMVLAVSAAAFACTDANAAPSQIQFDDWGRVLFGLKTMPRQYVDYSSAFAILGPALRAERQADLAFAVSSGTLQLLEVPWGPVAAHHIVYFGIEKGGKRVALANVILSWRYHPTQVDLGSGAFFVIPKSDPIIQAIRLGLSEPNLTIRAPDSADGIVTADGMVDGQELDFVATAGRWSVVIGNARAITGSRWHYQGLCDRADCESPVAIYSLIEKSVQLYRSGVAGTVATASTYEGQP